MTCQVYTARYSIKDADRLDITRAGCDRLIKAGKPAPGEVLAPSWELLRPALEWRRNFEDECGKRGLDLDAEYFKSYGARYRLEMRHSYRARRSEWSALLARTRVVLVCFCKDPTRCHRSLAAECLAACGAEYKGEIDR